MQLLVPNVLPTAPPGSVGRNGRPAYRGVRTPHASAALTGLAATVLLFVAVPLANFLSLNDDSGLALDVRMHTLPPPPPPPQELALPPPKEETVAKPELKERPPPLTLAAIDALLNPGTGSAQADFSMAGSLPQFDALAELEAFQLSELDKHPVPIQRIAPVYPYEAKQAGLEGWVKVLFIVDANGMVVSPRIEGSSHREFENSTLDAIRLWRFTPGVKDGKNVRTWMLVPFHFTIRE